MRSSHIRILVILAIVTLVGIISTQVYWVSRAIDQQDQVFSYNIQVALRNVVESLCEASGKEFPAENLIEQVSSNYFIVRTNDRIDLETLDYLITAEVEKRAITEDFEYGVYDCQNDRMVYSDNVNLDTHTSKSRFPELADEEYYFGVYFPEKARTAMGGMDVWKFTTLLTLVVVVFFGYGLFVILRQKRLSEIQRDFVNNVTHELKTPLATLSLASNTIAERFPKEAGKYAHIIREETERLQVQVEKILHGSLLERRRGLKKEKIMIYPFLSSLVERFKHHYEGQGIRWELRCKAISFVSDGDLLDNVISNLVDNAVNYGGKQITITASQSAKTVISVRDDGMGIPAAHQGRVFRKFYRVPEDQNQHNVKGFGLGLYIVKESVRKLGGKISLRSTEGEGTTFIITIPNG